MSSAAPHVGKSRVVELVTGDLARVELTKHLDYAAQLDLYHDGRNWQYGVTVDGDVERIQVFEDHERLRGADNPDWLPNALEEFGIPGGLV